LPAESRTDFRGEFQPLNDLALQTGKRDFETGRKSLERKEMQGDWIDHLVLKESNVAYGDAPERQLHNSNTPTTPIYSWIPSKLKS
jgi:hypothetical protein